MFRWREGFYAFIRAVDLLVQRVECRPLEKVFLGVAIYYYNCLGFLTTYIAAARPICMRALNYKNAGRLSYF